MYLGVWLRSLSSCWAWCEGQLVFMRSGSICCAKPGMYPEAQTEDITRREGELEAFIALALVRNAASRWLPADIPYRPIVT